VHACIYIYIHTHIYIYTCVYITFSYTFPSGAITKISFLGRNFYNRSTLFGHCAGFDLSSLKEYRERFATNFSQINNLIIVGITGIDSNWRNAPVSLCKCNEKSAPVKIHRNPVASNFKAVLTRGKGFEGKGRRNVPLRDGRRKRCRTKVRPAAAR